MKKKLVTFLLVCIMSLSFAVPVMATEVIQKYEAAEQGIVPFTEQTRMYFRWHNGNLQSRVWSITNGRWMTDWVYV
ncbi:MAG: hypothetical protein FWF81_10900 [Defluviitaleaceae bacterium]|nr:hypothetical protein [Defluviitaleaceae bacterium]